MKPQKQSLEPGLYLVATPIGNARDITLRALDILSSADILAAEDTRTLRKLMDIHGLVLGGRPLIAYHDHSGAAGRAGLVKLIADGKSVAYVSEAGMPLIADPGYALARDVGAAGHAVTAAPGASAALTALSLSGLPTDRFLFAGFPPTAKGARKRWLDEVLAFKATLVIYESPKRIRDLLGLVCDRDGNRPAALCRELTKKFEEVLRGSVAELSDAIVERSLKGEIVLVLGQGRTEVSAEEMEAALRQALETMSLKTAAAAVAGALGLPRRKVYQAALAMAAEK